MNTSLSSSTVEKIPSGATAVLVLEDGTFFWGRGIGTTGQNVGEVVFNTSMTGYQEVLTDLSYAGQIITFTFPHVGNVGTNPEDLESITPAVRGCIIREDITNPSNYRAVQHLDSWLKSNNLIGLAGLDTRRLTRHIRDGNAPRGVICHDPIALTDLKALQTKALKWPGLNGMDLAKEVTCHKSYGWTQTVWSKEQGFGDIAVKNLAPKFNVVAVDYGAKLNILRCLANSGCKVTVVPATSTTEDILNHDPDGVFLSNGPGDPAATGKYAVPVIKDLIEIAKPIFGICLGHQLLAIALGAKTYKLALGHRGANQPVQDLETGKVEITSQNHGFAVDRTSIPENVVETHKSLFDGVVEGIRAINKPAFSVQYHPEASPGPQDSHYLFSRFTKIMANQKAK
ncbi:MAG: carbamoyl phosphate synthase small subunit [Candidatus Marinimicrobia bacterium]|nr:carbamoyl phosphate synthase small subunit [Candidatus Neomarinimicrobiota bacterium]